MLTVLRYLCMLTTLFLPALYIAAVTFHPEMLPTKLTLSIIAAKQDVPFTSIFEVLILLIAFEIIQEAGLRLPGSIGQTVSILGGLVVGSAAVEARIVSPAVLIVVAIAGIAGYTMPSQDLAGALRLWRFLLALCASVGGLFGIAAGAAALVFHLAGIESFGVAYLTPFAANAGEQVEGRTVLRQPLPKAKLREAASRSGTGGIRSESSPMAAAGGRGLRRPHRCAPLDALPYAYEIEDTVLLRTLGVDMATQRLDGRGGHRLQRRAAARGGFSRPGRRGPLRSGGHRQRRPDHDAELRQGRAVLWRRGAGGGGGGPGPTGPGRPCWP